MECLYLTGTCYLRNGTLVPYRYLFRVYFTNIQIFTILLQAFTEGQVAALQHAYEHENMVAAGKEFLPKIQEVATKIGVEDSRVKVCFKPSNHQSF